MAESVLVREGMCLSIAKEDEADELTEREGVQCDSLQYIRTIARMQIREMERERKHRMSR
jgi:hypothetical protein